MNSGFRRSTTLVYRSVIACTLLFAVGEFFARQYLGLGTPPLTMVHPTIEYLYRPNQDVSRFGNRFLVNEYGMRSPSFTRQKAPGEFRIMMFGDSVVNGGNYTDHGKLATTILTRQLEKELQKEVIVGNVSAGSWGPGNWLAYAKEYGFFDADVVILVLSSHDLADNPEFAELNPNTHPAERPISALLEGITRYLPRYIPLFKKDAGEFVPPVISDAALSRGMQDLKEFLILAKQATLKVYILHHLERDELSSKYFNNADYYIRQLSVNHRVPVVSLKNYLSMETSSEKTPYRDRIHLNDFGQELLAKAAYDCIVRSFNNDAGI